MKKFFVYGMVVLLVCPLFAQQTELSKGLHSEIVHKGFLEMENDEIIFVMGKGEKDAMILTESSTWDDDQNSLGGFIKKGSTQYVYLQVLMASLIAQEARIYTIICGPTFGSVVSNWYPFKKKELGSVITWTELSFLNKGCYTISVFVESNKIQSGAGAMATFKVWVY